MGKWKQYLEEYNSKKTIFLGGTCNNSTWRDDLIPLLDINYFNPIVKDWTEEAQKEEIKQRENCDFCLYVITPKMTGVYSIAEVIEDAIKRPDKTIFCVLEKDGKLEFDKVQLKSLAMVSKMVEENKAKVCKTLQEIADFVNR